MKAIRNPVQTLEWNVPGWMVVMTFVFMAFGFFGYLGYAQKNGAIVRGVYIDRVNLSGLTPGEASALLRKTMEKYLNEPVTLVYGDYRPSFVPRSAGIGLDYDGMARSAYRIGHHGSILIRIYERLILTVRPQYLPLKLKIKHGRLEAFYSSLEEKVNVKPSSVHFDADSSGRVAMTRSQAGKRLNLGSLTRVIKNEIWQDGERVLAMPVDSIRPQLVETDLEKWSFQAVIGIYTTRFNPRDVSRSNNLKLAAAALDNCLVKPGQTFSFNGQVGPRVPANGYREANVILMGKLVPGVGGGVCQVSGTLYNALLFGGFSTFSRSNHSLPSSYVPLGRDATVVYGARDFTFTNTLPFPVLIATSYNPSGYLTVAILGSKAGDHQIRLDSVIKSTIPFQVKEEDDPTLQSGERKVEEKGKNGYQVEVWRSWFGPDKKLLRRERISLNFYPPIPSIIKVGPQVKAGEPSTFPIQTPNTNPTVKGSE